MISIPRAKIYLFILTATLLFGSDATSQSGRILLRAGHSANTNEPYHLGLTEFARIVNQKSNGRVEVLIYPNNQLGNEKEMIEGLLLGTLDIAVPSNGVVTNFVPRLGIFDLPFLFRSREHMYQVLDGPIGRQLNSEMQKRGLHLLGFYEAGIRHIMTRDRPIHSIQDLEGLKIRTMGVPEHVASFDAFGAIAAPLAYSELYGALQTGLVDGAEAANTNYSSKKFYEVAPYWAQIGWTTLVADLLMSVEKFRSLPADIQKILTDAGTQSAKWERNKYAESDEHLLTVLKSKGIQITYPDPLPFREASREVYSAFLKSREDRELLEAIQSLK